MVSSDQGNIAKFMIGITSYGAYVPRYRVPLSDIAKVWGKSPEIIKNSLKIEQKSVPGQDEDAVTIAIDAASDALIGYEGSLENIDALFVGSESHPYAVNPTSTIVGQMLGIGNDYLAADLQFACKAATAGIQAACGLIADNNAVSALVIGADAAQSKPHDMLEYTSAAAGVALILGTTNVAARRAEMVSYSSDTADFWRRDGIAHPSHAGRFTGEPAYFAHVEGAANLLMKKSGITPDKCAYCVFHMPNGKFPRTVAKRLGFTKEQLLPSLTIDKIGNPYSASALLGLVSVLDTASAGDVIFMVSYGSGAGSDGFLWEVTEDINQLQQKRKKAKRLLSDYIGDGMRIDYTTYLKHTGKL